MKNLIPVFIIVFFILMNVDFDKKQSAVARSIDLREADGFVAFITNDEQEEVVEPDDNHTPSQCECKGTGYITHGDGHRTKCPCDKCGCSKTKEPEVSTCQCGCNKEGCECSIEKKVQETPLKEEVFVIEKWTATWCAPCKQWNAEQKPILEKAGYEVKEMDYDLNSARAQELGITRIPTVVLYKNGVIIEKKVWFMANDIINTINKAKEE